MVVGLLLVLEREPAVGNMIQVLEPFEERDGHTAGVNVEIWNDEDVPVDKYPVGSGCSGSVGGFGDDL